MRLTACFFILFIHFSYSQEIVSDLTFNTQIVQDHELISQKRVFSSISLPFFDDFSNYKGYPKSTHWEDQDAFINTNLPFEPINIGVATLDALDAFGNPRNIISPSSHGDADYLTSKPLDISGYSQLYFSFYFQPEGIGNSPEANDILELEFKDTSSNWLSVWDTLGFNIAPFQKIAITIDNPAFLHDNFQFRFHNKATLSGNFDHWHIDNVLLTEDYNLFLDEEDVSFLTDEVRLLKHYHQMPWRHFQSSQDFWMSENMDSRLRNNYTITQSVDYRYDVFDSQSLIYHYPTTGPTRNDNIFDYASTGIYSYSQHSAAPIELYNYLFTDNGDQQANFQLIQSIATDDGDYFKNNDTLVHTQYFQNFYALDDGSAEASYGLNTVGGKVAMRFNLAKPDTLKAVQIHFEQNLIDVSNSAFQIVIWENDEGIPGNPIDTCQILFYPEYTNEFNGFYEYILEDPVYLSSSFFIGWQQFYNDILNIGLDKNTVNNDRMYYNIASSWQQSSCADCQGTWMMRPVFGSLTTTHITNEHNNDFVMYPNPSTDIVNITYEYPFTFRVFDVRGSMVYFKKNASKSIILNTSNLEEGMYVVELVTNSQILRKKLIIK